MSGVQTTERVQTVMAPGDLRATDHGPFARPSRSEATRRLGWLALGAERRLEDAS